MWLPADQQVVYFLNVCCHGRRRIFLAPTVVLAAAESLHRIAVKHGWTVPHACFMPDHVHFFASPMINRDQEVSRFVQFWKSSAKQRINALGMPGRIWQLESFDHLLRCDESLGEKWEYVRNNPVRAGLCGVPEGYPFSGSLDEIMQRCRRMLGEG